MSIIKPESSFFVFSEIKNHFYVSLAPFLLSRGLNLSVINYRNPGKHMKT